MLSGLALSGPASAYGTIWLRYNSADLACLELRDLDPIRLRLEHGNQVDAISHLLG